MANTTPATQGDFKRGASLEQYAGWTLDIRGNGNVFYGGNHARLNAQKRMRALLDAGATAAKIEHTRWGYRVWYHYA